MPVLRGGVSGRMLSGRGIDFSDGFLIVAIGFVLFWAIDPFTLQLWRFRGTRHLPTLLGIAAVVLCAAGRLIFRPETRRELPAAFRSYLGLTLFAGFVVAGSLYGKYMDGVDNNFLAMGFFLILGGPLNLWIIATSRDPLAVIRGITALFVAVSVLAVAENAVRFGELVFHSVENAVLVAVAFPLIAGRNVVVRAAGVALVMLGAIAQNKLTGHIVMLMVFTWVFVDELMIRSARDTDRVRAGLYMGMGIWVLFVALVAALGVYEATKSLLPDGNTVYRMHTYRMAFDRFLDSWLWGRAFAAPSVDYFDLFVVNTSTQYLPTHNDLLDILANGGLLAAIPFAWGLVSILLTGWNALRAGWGAGRADPRPQRAQLAMYFLIVAAGLPVMAFNPVLNQPSLAYVYWIATSVMCALAAITRTDRAGTTSPAMRGSRSQP